MPFRSILCPVDFSWQARKALQHALALARQFDGRVTVLYVSDPMLVAAANAAYRGRRGYTERTHDELARFVKVAVGAARGDQARVTLLVSDGNPADEILRQAKLLRSDVIVMGTQGASGLPRVVFGSTAERVLRKASVPVLVIPRRLKR